MFAKSQSEHHWLDTLVGDWTFDHEYTMPDGTTSTTPGRMHCRLLGGLWLICESTYKSEDGGEWSSIMTVGFDPSLGRYVGTFIGSMMSTIWHYQGVMDASGKRLPLESEGPRLDGAGTCLYRDTIEILDNDHWLFNSELQNDDGTWVQFMSGKHIRD